MSKIKQACKQAFNQDLTLERRAWFAGIVYNWGRFGWRMNYHELTGFVGRHCDGKFDEPEWDEMLYILDMGGDVDAHGKSSYLRERIRQSGR
jgi:hypothetical protein